MNRIKEKITSLILYMGLIFLIYTFAISLFVKTPYLISLPAYLMAVILGICIALVYLGLRQFRKLRIEVKERPFLIALLSITFIIRMIWIIFIDTVPVSDFGFYYDYAVSAYNGNFKAYDVTATSFPHRMGFPIILSLIFRIFGDGVFVAKLLNVIVSVATVFVIYKLGKMLFGEKSGMIAGILFAFWPSQIVFNSVVASEHLFVLFIAVPLVLLVKMDSKESVKSLKDYVILLLAGIALGLSQVVRPLGIMMFPVFVIYLLLSGYKGTIKDSLINKGKILGVLLIGFLICFNVFNFTIFKLSGISISKSSSGFSLLEGTNYEALGAYNDKDAAITAEYKWDVEKISKEATRRAIERIKSNPMNFIRLIEMKYPIMWGNEKYASDWSLHELKSRNSLSDLIENNRVKLDKYIQLYYLGILFLSVIGCWYLIKYKNKAGVAFLLIFLAHVALYTFFEVQSRYHFPAVVFLLPIAGYGIYRFIYDRIKLPGL